MNILYYLKLTKIKFLIEIKKILEYKVNFLTSLHTIGIEMSIFILFWGIIFKNTLSINGWNFQDTVLIIFFIYSIGTIKNLIVYSINSSFREIKLGGFDKFLIYPSIPQFNILTSNMLIFIIVSEFLLSIFLFIYILQFYSIINIILGFLFGLLGVLCFSLFLFILGTLAFFTKESGLIGPLLQSTMEIGRYPLTFLNTKVRFIITFIIPIIFLFTIPAEIARNNFNIEWIMNALILFLILTIIAKFMWNLGLKKYESGMG